MEFIINEQVKNQLLEGLILERNRLGALYEDNEHRINNLMKLKKIDSDQEEPSDRPSKESQKNEKKIIR